METLALQPPLLGESRAIEALREFIIAVSLREDPVLVTGAVGTGKSLAAGKIHAIGPHATLPCHRLEAEELDTVLLDALLVAGGDLPPGALLVRNAERLRPGAAARLAGHIDRRGLLPRVLLTSRHAPGEVAWDKVRRAGLDPEGSGLAHVIPPLVERREDIPAISRYQVWLHTIPDVFEARWDAFEDRVLPRLVERAWPGNVAELIGFVVSHVGGDATYPRRWAGEQGKSSAQEEFLRRELAAAFELLRVQLADDTFGGPSWLLPRAERGLTLGGCSVE